MSKYKSLQEVQLSQDHLSFLQSFINVKYLKQEVDDDLSVCMDECSPVPSLYFDPHDQKVMMLLPPIKKYPIFYHGVAFTA